MRAYGEIKIRHIVPKHQKCAICFPGTDKKTGRARERRKNKVSTGRLINVRKAP
jgi:hypothetical protein